jgi:PD-(D/E)XK nuclease superfamily
VHQLSTSVSVREVYRRLQKTQTHLVQSTEIATAGVCQHLFKLSYPFGVIRGERDYLVANAVHDIMSLAIHGPILENWVHKAKEHTDVTKIIVKDSASITEQVTRETKEVAIKEARKLPESFDDDIADRFQGLVTGITKHLMRKYERPKRVISEITVTNILNHHEGRIDAILEFDNDNYGILDWKTYNINRANASGHERWQLISNMLLSNFRYTNNEDDWSKFLFASIVYYEGAYMPRLPISEKHLAKVKNDRFYAHQVLCGNYVRAEKPQFCPVCDTNAEGCSDCRFYREDSRMAFAGQLPDNYRKITGQLFGNRYKVLQERAETHRHKHVVDTMSNNLGETTAIRELEKYGILHSGYKFASADGTMVRFRSENEETFLEPKKVLRVIGKEDNISLLSCISEQATVMQVNDCELFLNFRSEATVERAKLQLFNLPLIMMRDEINLTRRMLEPLHKFHRLAAEFLVPKDCYGELEGLR